MAKGLSLKELADKLSRFEAEKVDMVVRAEDARMDDDGLVSVNGKKYVVTNHAHNQLATFTDISAPYYGRMRQHPELLAQNVNWWLEREGNNRMFRTYRPKDGQPGTLRAIVSPSFKVIDHPHVLRMVLPALEQIGTDNVTIHKCDVTENKLYLQILMKGAEHRQEVAVGDVVSAGVTITNGELGTGSLSVAPFVLRLVCTNGMVWNDRDLAKRTAHIGKKKGGVLESGAVWTLSDETIEAENKAVLLASRDVLLSCLKGEVFDMIVKRMRAAAGSEPLQRPESAVAEVVKQHGLVKSEGETILANLMAGGHFSQWDLANAVTAAAHYTENFDSAHHLERVGGKIVELNRSEWTRLVNVKEAA